MLLYNVVQFLSFSSCDRTSGYAIMVSVIYMLNLNTYNLSKVLRDYYTVTHIRSVIFDENLQELIAYPPEKADFCHTICADSELSQKCDACDRKLCERCKKEKTTVTAHCHMGLIDAVVPIYDHSGVIGYIMFGQVLPAENHIQVREKMKHLLSEEKFPGIGAVIDALPVKSEREMEASATLLQAAATYFLSNNWVVPQRAEFIRNLDQYIDSHIADPITVDDICIAFHMRRTRLYNAVREYLNCGIAQYIKKRRIQHACNLLSDSDMSISEIAYSVGYMDYCYFSQIFKDVTGTSASNYRKQLPHQKTES